MSEKPPGRFRRALGKVKKKFDRGSAQSPAKSPSVQTLEPTGAHDSPTTSRRPSESPAAPSKPPRVDAHPADNLEPKGAIGNTASPTGLVETPAITSDSAQSQTATSRPAHADAQPTVETGAVAGAGEAGVLWSRAYDGFKKNEPRLVEKYEKLLSAELAEQDTGISPSNVDPSHVPENLDKTDNRIDGTSSETRSVQMAAIISRSLEKVDKEKTKFTIAGREIVLKEQAEKAAKIIQQFKVLIDNAVRASPEASLAWAGFCVILPLFTIPAAAEKAIRGGLTYVTSRLHYYTELGHLLFPDSLGPGLKKEFENLIVELYQHILGFQVKSVLSFYRTWCANVGREWIQQDDWTGMLAKVKELENAVDKKSEIVNALASRRCLEDANKATKALTSHMQDFANVAGEILEVSKDHRDISSQHLAEHKHTNEILEGYVDKAPLNLPVAGNALWDSAADRAMPICHENTGRTILDRIDKWVNDPDGGLTFLLSGPAGTGKSTIARTLARVLAQEGQLGASYFFKKEDASRSGTSLLLPTIADRLSCTVPQFKANLRQSLRILGEAKLEEKNIETQFKTLLLDPFANLCLVGSANLTRVIIIDALDECECRDDLALILSLLPSLGAIEGVHLRVLVTSRSDHDIVEACERSDVLRLDLLQHFKDNPDDAKAGIRTFLEAKFRDIKIDVAIPQDPWPSTEQLDRLTQLAINPEPLFIYAATLCRFVYDRSRRKNPKTQLDRWFEQSDKGKSQLSQIYEPILTQFCPDDDDEDDKFEKLRMLGAIVLLKTPLPAESLARLLEMDPISIKLWLRDLHAVLDIPADSSAPVRLLHKSFSDFILDEEGTGAARFRISAADIDDMLASKCSKRIANGLRRNICNIQDPAVHRDDIDQRTIDAHILPDLKYACLSWRAHLTGQPFTNYDEIWVFFHSHFLHWLEALLLIGDYSGAAALTRRLVSIYTLSSTDAKKKASLGRFAKHLRHVFVSSLNIARVHPLQVYGTTLVFSSTASELRKVYWKERLRFIDSVQELEGHTGYINAVAFSADDKMLASASDDCTVRLWDAATGAHLQTLKGHTDWVTLVAFSRDGKMLASASSDCTVRLWDAATGAHLQTLKGDIGWVKVVAFSPDGKMLASCSNDKTVRLWDPATGADRHTLIGHTGLISVATFSPDSEILASGSDDGTIRLWDPATGAHLQTLEGHQDLVIELAFSRDGKMLASTLHGGTVELWDVATVAHQQKNDCTSPPQKVASLTISQYRDMIGGVVDIPGVPDSENIGFPERNDWGDGLDVDDGRWLTRSGKRLVQVKYGYDLKFVSCGDLVVLGHYDGPMVIVRLRSDTDPSSI